MIGQPGFAAAVFARDVAFIFFWAVLCVAAFAGGAIGMFFLLEHIFGAVA